MQIKLKINGNELTVDQLFDGMQYSFKLPGGIEFSVIDPVNPKGTLVAEIPRIGVYKTSKPFTFQFCENGTLMYSVTTPDSIVQQIKEIVGFKS